MQRFQRLGVGALLHCGLRSAVAYWYSLVQTGFRSRVRHIGVGVFFGVFFFFFFFRGQVATLGRNELNMLCRVVLVGTLARNEIYMLCLSLIHISEPTRRA